MTTYVSNYTALLYSRGSGADKSYTNYGGDFRGTPVFITYSFLTDSEASKESKTYGADYYKGYTSAQKAVFRATIADLEASSSIKFIEVDNPKYAAIRAYVAYGSDVGGWGSVLGAGSNGVNVTDASAFSSLSRAKQVIAHELGHNVGLKHPFEGDIRLNSSVDNKAHTIMSYNSSGFNGSAPYQEYDKDAFKFLYGSDTNFSSRLKYSWSDSSGRFTVTGSSGGDKIYGVDAYNSLYGGSGNDTVIGRDFADKIYGGNNDDRIYGGGGKDTLYGGDGNDRLYGQSNGNYYGGSGSDVLTYTNSKYGAIISLTSGITLNSIERIEGSNFGDYFYGDNSASSVFGLNGNDNLYGRGGHDSLHGGSGDDSLNGEDGNDRLYGDSGNDYLYGGAGNDYLRDDGGTDRFYGGDGSDMVSYFGWYVAGKALTVNLLTGANNSADTYSSIENIYGSNRAPDNLTGNNGANKINGNAGNDRLYGLQGNDTLYGGSGNDNLSGDDGNDRLYGDSGNDNLYGGNGDDYLRDDGGTDRFYGGEGSDWVSYVEWYVAGKTLSVNLLTGANNSADTYSSIENIYGSNRAPDSLTGNNGANKINGNAGNDVLYGLGGEDSLHGGSGNDNLYGADGNDRLYGDSGNDNLYGGAGDDYLRDDGGTDRFYGGEGSDWVSYLEWYVAGKTLSVNLLTGVNNSADTYSSIENIYGSDKAPDNLTGNNGANSLSGNAGNDRLYGLDGDDRLRGGDGNDILDGGAGNDICYGDAGADVFVFKANYGKDTISDFQDNSDKIKIEAVQGFDDLALTSVGDSTSIDYGSGTILLSQISQGQITQSDFLFA